MILRGNRISEEDVIFNLAPYRLPYEFVIENKGANAIGKYGTIIAMRWLRDLGIKAVRNRELQNSRGRTIKPDLFEESTRTVYEVKTGLVDFSRESRAQALGYRRAMITGQVKQVIYLNVAICGRVGPSQQFRYLLEECGFKVVILT
jgi:hypothetical protein